MSAKDVHYTDPSRESDPPEYDEEAAAEYVSNLQPIKEQKRKSKRNKLIFIIVFLVLLASGAAAYFFLKPDKPEQTPQTTQPQTEQQAQIVESEKYNSTEMRLSFNYPKNWKIDDATPGLIKVESAVTKLKDVNGEQADGKVVVTFLSAGSEVPGFKAGTSATAMMDSVKITYESPSQSQREQTYLSFAGFGATGLDAVFVTGDNGYQKDQLIPESDVKKSEPIISVTFYGCNDAKCEGEGSGSYTVATSEWSDNQMLQAAQAILKSLRVE